MTSQKPAVKTICCVGEVMIELINTGQNQATLGVAGDTYNTAVYLKRLLKTHKTNIAYCTVLGEDPYSRTIRTTLSHHGLDTSYIETRHDKMPGLYAIDVDDRGERSFSYWRSDSAARKLFQPENTIGLSALKDFDLIYLSGITLAILPPQVRADLAAFIAQYRTAGGLFAYDSNYRPRLWENQATAREINTQMWQLADIALPSLDDEMALFGDPCEADVVKRLQAYGISHGALKRGALGPLNLQNLQAASDLDPVDKVIDSTAAGDSFNAGFLAAFVQNLSIKDQLAAGHRLAARVITHRGAILPE